MRGWNPSHVLSIPILGHATRWAFARSKRCTWRTPRLGPSCGMMGVGVPSARGPLEILWICMAAFNIIPVQIHHILTKCLVSWLGVSRRVVKIVLNGRLMIGFTAFFILGIDRILTDTHMILRLPWSWKPSKTKIVPKKSIPLISQETNELKPGFLQVQGNINRPCTMHFV